jgi:hypothetical protein
MNKPEAAAPDADSRFWLVLTFATLAAALALRLDLAARGGQGYWPDEARYAQARGAVNLFSRGEPRAAWLALVGSADHPLFRVIALPAAWADERFGDSGPRAAAYLGLYSVAALALIGICARAAGARRREAWLAVFFAACANSLFYYARSLLPYDAALALEMASLALALGPAGTGRSVAAGILAALGFLAYDGYWMLGAVILSAHVIRAHGQKEAIRRALAAGIGLALPLAAAVGAARALGGDLVGSLRQFSGTISQGDFGRGHAFVWQYLWSAEKLMLAFWMAAAAYSAVRAISDRSLVRPVLWIAFAGALYVGLWFCADVLRVFVVYGRTARVLVPFLCLLAAWAVDDIWSGRKWRRAPLIGLAAAVAAGAAFNLSASLRIVWPQGFVEEARGLVWRSPPGVFRFRNLERLSPGESTPGDEATGNVVLSRPHPLQFRPYLFEGYTEAQRSYLAGRDLAMRIERTPVDVPAPFGGFPGPIRIRLRFPAGRVGTVEPLVTTGGAGDACQLSVAYTDAGHLSFGFGCMSGRQSMSAPQRVDRTGEHTLVVSIGSLLPPSDPPGADAATRVLWDRMRRSVLMMLDDGVVLAEDAPTHPSDPGQVNIGLNLVGYSPAGLAFTGSILSVQAVGLDEVAGRLRSERTDALRPAADWTLYPGPLHVRVKAPTRRADLPEPLVTAGADESLSLVRDGKGDLRLEYGRGGSAPVRSDLLPAGPDGDLDLEISLGGLMPPDGAPVYSKHPGWLLLRDEIWATANGSLVLARRAAPGPEDPGEIRLFSNLRGFPNVEDYFAGQVEFSEAADPADVADRISPLGLPAGAPSGTLAGYSGPLRIRLEFPAAPQPAMEPILVSGVPGAGDMIYVKYGSGGKAQFGLDHWAHGGPISDAIDLASGGPVHDVVVSDGALLPPPGDPLYAEHPAWTGLRDWVVVALDGRPVLVVHQITYPARPDEATMGLNLIGGSTTGRRFSGRIVGVEPVPPDSARGWIERAPVPRAPGP